MSDQKKGNFFWILQREEDENVRMEGWAAETLNSSMVVIMVPPNAHLSEDKKRV